MDGGSGSAKHGHAPEGLLRSALEKIVFFECRVSQLESELSAAHAVAERARADAAQAGRRAVELEQALSAEKARCGELERRAADGEERVRLLESERERLLGGLVERARIAGAAGEQGEDGEEGQADLAGFIAELRAEIESLRAFKASALAAGFAGDPGQGPPPAAPARGREAAASVAELGGRFDAAGRVGVSAGEAARMRDHFATRADRALYERSMVDLDGADPGRRLRAVHALEALGSRAAAPLLAAALGREREAEVKAALLAALARLKEPFAADLAERELADARPAVRVAALETLAAGGDPRAVERLAAALRDDSAIVRRRAALLLGFTVGARAEEALAVALSDVDRGVARAAAAALSGRASSSAQAALARGLEHGDVSVRRAAAAALGRLSGETVDADGPVSARRASGRRIAEKLSAMGAEELRSAVLRSAAAPAPAAPSPRPSPPLRGGEGGAWETPTSTSTATSTATATATSTATTTPTATTTATTTSPPTASAIARAARTAVAVLAGPEGHGEGAPSDDLEPLVLGELRASLRGCAEDHLARVLGAPATRVEAALAALASRGAAERRGSRWFMT